jgi:5-methylcytosine-specific restriction endonuclease McrA
MGRFSLLASEMGDLQRLAWEEVWIYAKDCSVILKELPEHRRRAITFALIEEMLSAQNGKCAICNCPIDRSTLGAFHVDHIIPFKHGGGGERTNLQLVHPNCNWDKGAFVDIRDLVPYLEQRAESLE